MRSHGRELDQGANGQARDGGRHPHLVRSGLAHHPRREVDPDAADVVVSPLHLTGVDAGADVHAQHPEVLDHLTGTALIMLARHMARRQLIGLAALAVVGGLGLSVVMIAAADARRADTAYSRLRVASLAPDALFDASGLSDQDIARLAALPDVTGIARFSYTPVAPSPLIPGQDGGAFVGLDPDLLLRVYRPLVLSGRLADPARADEVVVNEAMARAGNLHVGQSVSLYSGFERPVPIGTATVVGIVRGIFDVGANAGNASMLLGKGFLERHRDVLEIGPQPATLLRLADGEAGLAGFERRASAAVGQQLAVGFSGSLEAVPVNRTLRVQTVGLAILALVAGLATLVAVVQALKRVLERALVDLPTLVSIGVLPRHRVVLGVLLAVPMATCSAAVAAAAALVASPHLPTGFARTVDPVRGVHIDALVVSLGALAWVLVLGGAGAVLAWRLAPGAERTTATGRLHRLLSQLPHRAQLGCEWALAPLRSAGGAAARSAVIAGALSVTGVVAVSTFGASLAHLLDTPSLQGWSFDAAIGNGDSGLDDLRASLDSLPSDPAVSRVAWVTLVDLQIQGIDVEAYAFDSDGEGVHPTMRSGRRPLADDEIALGADLLRRGNLSIGDRVEVGGPTGKVALVVVGSATYPEIGTNSDLGTSASLTRGAARRVGSEEHGGAALVTLAPGHAPAALDKYADVGEIVTPFRPPRVLNLEQVGSLPWVLAAFASTLGALAVGHGLWSSIRTRRRDLAVLASIGYRPRDIRAMVLWQVACVAVIAVVVGSVAGVLLGGRAWSIIAAATAVVDRSVTPLIATGLIGVGAFVVCAAVGLAGGRWVQQRPVTAGLAKE